MSAVAANGNATVTTPRGRKFPESRLRQAQQLEKQGFEYDYAFEILQQKSSFGIALEHLRKHPKKGGIFGKLKGKKNKEKKFPKLGDVGLVLSSNDVQDDVSPMRETEKKEEEPKKIQIAYEEEQKVVPAKAVSPSKAARIVAEVPKKALPEPKVRIGITPEQEVVPEAPKKALPEPVSWPVPPKRSGPSPPAIKTESPIRAVASSPKLRSPGSYAAIAKGGNTVGRSGPLIVVEDEQKYVEDHPIVAIPAAAPIVVVSPAASEVAMKPHSPVKQVISPDTQSEIHVVAVRRSPVVKKSYAAVLSSPVADPDSPFRKVASAPEVAAMVEDKDCDDEEETRSRRMPPQKPYGEYEEGDDIEILRSNGKWVLGQVLEREGKFVLVEYFDKGLKYQKKMPVKSQHLAVAGTNCELPTTPVVQDEDDEDNGFNTKKAGRHSRNQSPSKMRYNKSFNGTWKSELTVSTAANGGKKNRPKSAKAEPSLIMEEDNSSAKQGSQYSYYKNDKFLMHPSKPTPDYEVGDLVNIKCSDNHWYRGKLLDVGEQAVLVEYKRKKTKYQKKLPLRSMLLRFADDDDVSSVTSTQSLKSSMKRKVGLEALMVKEKNEQKKKMSEPAGIPKAKKSDRSSGKTPLAKEDSNESSSKNKTSEPSSRTESRASNNGTMMELLRKDGIWYEARTIKSGAKNCIVEYIVEGKKFQKQMPLDSELLAPFGTNIFVADIGDDIEYLTTRGDWVKAQVCEIQEAYYVILYMEGADLVEKKIVRCSKNLSKYGVHTVPRGRVGGVRREIKV